MKHAIKKLKNHKTTGTDLIAAEMLKALDDGPIEKLTQLCNEIYNTGYWPKDLKDSIFIPIPKKPKATRCQEYRTISIMIMSQVTKLLLKIVIDRMKMKIETELDDAQKVQKYVYICFFFFFSSGFSRHLGSPLWLLIVPFQ